MNLEPLLTLEEVIEGFPAKLEIRQEPDGNELITHVTLIIPDRHSQRYDMRYTPCKDQNGSEEPRWQFIQMVPEDLKALEFTISEAISERDR